MSVFFNNVKEDDIVKNYQSCAAIIHQDIIDAISESKIIEFDQLVYSHF